LDGSDGDPAMDIDAADGTDADASQILSQDDGDIATTDPCKIADDRPPDVLEGSGVEGSGDHSIEFYSNFSDTSSVVIDAFPFGNPGAPIPGLPQDPTAYEQFQATRGETWAPFKSQRDWDIAHWAKTHNISSSALDELLAILVPEVWIRLIISPIMTLILTARCLMKAGFHIAQSSN
jgi:hypothetical protein